jgi:predicted RNA-binding Zn-ribbon protein involved in translation (DUF1610 family)
MDEAVFATWLGGIEFLTPAQRGRTYQALAMAEANEPFECAGTAIDTALSGAKADPVPYGIEGKTIAGPPGQDLLSKVGRDRIANFGCPHCGGGGGVHRWGDANGKPRYRCTSCRKTFTPLTGTPLAGLHHPERWTDQAAALISGESLARAAKRCEVHPTTAFR